MTVLGKRVSSPRAIVNWLTATTRRKRGLVACAVAATVILADRTLLRPPHLVIYPEDWSLRVGEQIHYWAFVCDDEALKQVDYRLHSRDPAVVRVVGAGAMRLEAMSPGTTEVLVKRHDTQRILSIQVEPETRSPMPATPDSDVRRFAGDACSSSPASFRDRLFNELSVLG